MSNKRNALVPVPKKSAVAMLEQSLSITIEIGGYFMIYFRDDCLVTLLQNAQNSMTRLPIEHKHNWSVTLDYWHLDDDLIEVSVSAQTNREFADGFVRLLPPHAVLARMVDRCRAQFLRKLAKKQIQLVGKRGQLV